jgi:hypothetical protein
VATRGLKVVSSNLLPPKDPDADLRVSFLELVVEDGINHRRYDLVIVGTPRGLTFNVVKRTELPDDS